MSLIQTTKIVVANSAPPICSATDFFHRKVKPVSRPTESFHGTDSLFLHAVGSFPDAVRSFLRATIFCHGTATSLHRTAGSVHGIAMGFNGAATSGRGNETESERAAKWCHRTKTSSHGDRTPSHRTGKLFHGTAKSTDCAEKSFLRAESLFRDTFFVQKHAKTSKNRPFSPFRCARGRARAVPFHIFLGLSQLKPLTPE